MVRHVCCKHVCFYNINIYLHIYLGCGPLPVTVTTRIITFLVGDSYKPSFATVTGRGPHPACFATRPSSHFWESQWLPNVFHLGRLMRVAILPAASLSEKWRCNFNIHLDLLKVVGKIYIIYSPKKYGLMVIYHGRYSPNGGLMVIYHGRISQKSPTK